MSVYLVYPERRSFSDEEICIWFANAVADGKIAPVHLAAGSVKDKAHALSNAGLIALGRPA